MEQAVCCARQAAAADLAEVLLQAGVVARAVVATDDPGWAARLAHLPLEVDVDAPDQPFHFGRRLAGLIRRYAAPAILYAGGGAAPLMSGDDWRRALGRFSDAETMAVTNNLHSSDWVALRSPAEWLPIVAAQERDNGLAWSLADNAGLPVSALAPSAASRFDLDTPTDLLIARACPRIGAHLRAALDGLEWPAAPVERAQQVMSQEGGKLAVIGRSSAAVWAALEQRTRCYVRFFVEERGMIASGRMGRGEVRSLLADFLYQVGVEGFVAELSALADAVLFDNRVLLAARGLWPSASDRYYADLLRWEAVQNPFLRRFSRAVGESDTPILMGGQSVVGGGLLALLEMLPPREEIGGKHTPSPTVADSRKADYNSPAI